MSLTLVRATRACLDGVPNSPTCCSTDGSGEIEKHELKAALAKLKILKTDAQVDDIIKKVDADGNGTINPEEFKVLAFDLLGLDENGYPKTQDEFPSGIVDERIAETASAVKNAAQETATRIAQLSGGLLHDELPKVCKLANSMSGVFLAYRFRHQMSESQFEHLRLCAVYKLAVVIAPYILDVVLEAQSGRDMLDTTASASVESIESDPARSSDKNTDEIPESQQTKENDTVEGPTANAVIGGALLSVREHVGGDTAAARTPLKEFMGTVLKVLREKIEEGKDEFNQHPILAEIKGHASKFGGDEGAALTENLGSLVTRKIDTALDNMDELCFKYVDEVTTVVRSQEFNQLIEEVTAPKHFGACATARHIDTLTDGMSDGNQDMNTQGQLEQANEMYNKILTFLQTTFDNWIQEAMTDMQSEIEELCETLAALLNTLLRLI